MLLVTPEETLRLRSQFTDFPDAIAALQDIEDCDGDLADAALSLALKADLEPDTNETWLADYAKRFRHIVCQLQFRQDLSQQQIAGLTSHLSAETSCPPLLALPVALYVVKTGVSEFCHSFDNSRV